MSEFIFVGTNSWALRLLESLLLTYFYRLIVLVDHSIAFPHALFLEQLNCRENRCVAFLGVLCQCAWNRHVISLHIHCELLRNDCFEQELLQISIPDLADTDTAHGTIFAEFFSISSMLDAKRS